MPSYTVKLDVMGGVIVNVPTIDIQISNPIITDADGKITLNYDGVSLILNSSEELSLNPVQSNFQPSGTSTTPPLALLNCNVGFSSIVFYPNGNDASAVAIAVIGYSVATGQNTYQIYANVQNPVSNATDIILLQPNANVNYSLNVSVVNGVLSAYLNQNGTSQPLAVLNATQTFTASTTFSSPIIASAGVQTTAGASSTVTVGASPYTYQNTSASNQQVFITGGVITGLTFNPNGTSGLSLNTGTSAVTLRKGDSITITYTTAPTVNTIQL